MTTCKPAQLVAAAGLIWLLAPGARAQYAITWYVTPCGGNATPIAAGAYALQSTIGDPLATGVVSAGAYTLGSGFLQGADQGATCYANCDGSTTLPVLTVNDFICFQSRFAAGDPYANCDGSTTSPALTVNDFICFQAAFASGCP
jgi:hypothetical protein